MQSSISDDIQAVAEAGVDWSDLAAQLHIACSVAQEQKVDPLALELRACSDEGTRSILIALYVDGDAELEHSLEYRLGERLSALPTWAPERLNITFECRWSNGRGLLPAHRASCVGA